MSFIMKVRQASRLTHQLAGGGEMDEVAEGVAFCFPVSLQTAEGGLVGEAERATEGVGEEAMCEVLREEVGVLGEVGAYVGGAVDGLAAILASGVDGGSIRVCAAEVADGVVGFEGESERINLRVAISASLHAAMLFQLLADGGGSADVGLDGRHIRRRRAGWCAEEFLQQPHRLMRCKWSPLTLGSS